jgi:hypothetical protein
MNPKKVRQNTLRYFALTIILAVSGYMFLRLAYQVSAAWPFTQEIVVTVLGTIATVLITALLLNQQTAVELRKEQSIKFLELKKEVYTAFIDFIEHLLTKGRLDKTDRLRMQVFSHRLAVIASPEVLEQYNRFQKAFYKVSDDDTLDRRDSDTISHELAELTVKIRLDLVGELDEGSHFRQDEITAQILRNQATDEKHQHN